MKKPFRTSSIRHLILAMGYIGVHFAAQLQAQEPDPKQLEFFEQKIRPVLVQHCYSCHSEKAAAGGKLKANLLLDSRDGLSKGGESGPAIVSRKSSESLLLKALRYEGLEMPPSGKLSEQIIADFAQWIDLGAIDSRDGKASTNSPRVIDIPAGRQFWSFQPLGEIGVPDIPDSPAVKTAIDRFILAKQKEHGLTPSRAAGKEKLLRRVYFDLLGLPPTPEQLAAFQADASPDAFSKVIDELLASERYGERWARHWLDTVRYAESGGYEFDGFRPGAYHYRDWVIRALNADLPYHEFIRLQLAGDKLKPGYEGAAATGFLVAGPFPGQTTAKTEERIRYDQLDDMIMTIGGSMLGITLGCVRCHDHKYDPIPQQDYYGIAASLGRTGHGPTIIDPDPAATQRAVEQHAAEHEQRLSAIRKFAADDLAARFNRWQQTELPKLTVEPRWQVLLPLAVSAEDTWLSTTDDGLVVFTGPRRKNGDTYVVTTQTYQKNLVALRLDAFTDKSMPRKGPGFGGDGSFTLGDFKVTARPLDPKSGEAPIALKLKPIQAAFEEPGQPLKNIVDDNPGTFWRSNADGGKDNAALLEIEGGLPGFASGTQLVFELKFVSDGLGRFRISTSTEPGPPTWAGEVALQHLAEVKALLAANNNTLPASMYEPVTRWFSRFDEAAGALYRALDDHQRAKPRPPLTEVYTAIPGGRDVFLLRRGEVDAKIGPAQPAFLQVLATSASGPAQWLPKPAEGQPASDPRVGLAHWITDVEQGAGALLARVIVNRLWQHHFGRGLVNTPNDFGAQGERPSHPELLDWLARELIHNGWKLKPIHKLILQSAVYQQSNEVTPENLKTDPLNRFLWHYRPQRLEAEVIRDSLLAVGGTLDTTMYGPSVLENTTRRSIYLRVKRSELIPFMTMFDAPEPTQSIGERTSTTIPTQALAMLNSPFVRQQAERLAHRIQTPDNVDFSNVVESAYRIAFSRQPTSAERDRMLAFLDQQRQTIAGDPAQKNAAALVEFCQVLLCLNEFLYVD
ncbi:MAG: PSD1 domain-containing protein [Planctomycetes bacterium]|nr:PSD1 domain-containing protein [Planctomycetota bacterium]